MAQPYNYSIQTPNIGEQFAQGYNQMAAFGAAQQAAEQRKQQQEQAALVQQKLTALAQNPNPSAQDYVEVANMLPKEQADSLRASFTTLSDDRQRGTLQFSGRALAALSSDNPQIGVDMLLRRAEAENNSGNVEDARFFKAMAESAKRDPVAVRDSLSVMVSTLPGGKDTVESAIKIAEDQRKRAVDPNAPPPKVVELQARARLAGLTPGTPEYNKFMITGGGVPAVQIDQRERDEFEKATSDRDAKFFGDLADQAPSVGQNRAVIGELENLLSNVDTGFGARIKSYAGSLGIPIEGVNEIQAAQAIIARLVPEQRAPGSGVMSDADLELFKQSLPSIINQPGGNELIIKTIKDVNDYQMEQSAIANKVFAGELTRKEGREALMELANPIDIYKDGIDRLKAPSSTGQPVTSGGFTLKGTRTGG